MSYDYGYNFGYDAGSVLGGILAGMLGFILLFSLIALVFSVLMIIGQWKCFKKAGYNGWECLIAGHNQFVNCTFAGVNPIFVLGVMFGSVVSVVPIIGWLAYVGFVIYYQFVVGINTAKAFGKGTGFGVALAIPLSAPIAWFVLGKDNVKYVGVKKESEVTSSNNQQSSLNPSHSEVQTKTEEVVPIVEQSVEPRVNDKPIQNNNCPRCGKSTNPGDKFCMNCGNQL